VTTSVSTSVAVNPNALDGTAPSAGVSRLQLRLPAQIRTDRVPAVLGGTTADWLGERLPEDDSGSRRFGCDLQLRVAPERHAWFRKSAIVSLGDPRMQTDGWVVPIEWRAASLAPLFPVLVGVVRLTAEYLEIDGYYAPPFGVLGYLGDRLVLGAAARGTARWFLETVARALP